MIVMDTELGRIVISALSTLSGMVVAYRSRSESSKVLAEQEIASVTPSSTDPWRWRADTVLISAEELDQIVAKAEASSEAGQALAGTVPEQVLREVLEHVDAEIARLQESIADTSRSKARRHRDLDHAEAEICVELKDHQETQQQRHSRRAATCPCQTVAAASLSISQIHLRSATHW